MLPHLKHVLENVFSGTEDRVNLSQTIKFTTDRIYENRNEEREIVSVQKVKNSWKAFDNKGGIFTISKLSRMIQSNLQINILSLRDTRVKPVQYSDLKI